MSTQLYLVFPDRETAGYVASALIGEPVATFHADGWWVNPETGERVYWNLDDIGALPATYDADGNQIAPAPIGYHINGWWHSENPIPPELDAFRFYPETPMRVWG
jgi:hypothetical protein